MPGTGLQTLASPMCAFLGPRGLTIKRAAPEQNYDEFDDATKNGGKVECFERCTQRWTSIAVQVHGDPHHLHASLVLMRSNGPSSKFATGTGADRKCTMKRRTRVTGGGGGMTYSPQCTECHPTSVTVPGDRNPIYT